MPSVRWSIVLPCFNEEAGLRQTLTALTAWFEDRPEIVVADDGSTDGTVRVAETFAAANPHVRVCRLPHRGKGAAIRSGMAQATGEYILLVDADLPFDRPSIEAARDALAAADVVLANRRHHDSRYTVPVRLFGFLYRRHLVGWTFNLLVRTLLRVGHRDTQCGLKGFRREAFAQMLPSLTTDGFAFDVEMILTARALGLRIAEVPVHVAYESAGSTVRIATTGTAMAGELARLVMRRAAGLYSAPRVRAAGARTSRPSEAPAQTAQSRHTAPEE